MKIILTGGGSGGHITPILSVADELKRRNPELNLIYIGQRGDKLADIPRAHPTIDEVYGVSAGKFRRYHGSGLKQLLDLPTMVKNIRDIFRLSGGIVQSYRLLGKLKPDVIFTPGGFVGVPVGIAAHWRRIPFVTHDLDAIPGLANRINARWATIHAVGQPKELYTYPQDKTYYVGVPIGQQYHFVTAQDQQAAKQQLGLTPDAPLLLITGGGLGAQRINEAALPLLPELLSERPHLNVCITTGRGKDAAFKVALEKIVPTDQMQRVMVKDFVSDLHVYSAAADVVVTRAGATTLAELAAQGKACIVIPNQQLTGGHQLKNAEALAQQQAIVVITETEMQQGRLKTVINEMLSNIQRRQTLSTAFHATAKLNAAQEIANLLLNLK